MKGSHLAHRAQLGRAGLELAGVLALENVDAAREVVGRGRSTRKLEANGRVRLLAGQQRLASVAVRHKSAHDLSLHRLRAVGVVVAIIALARDLFRVGIQPTEQGGKRRAHRGHVVVLTREQVVLTRIYLECRSCESFALQLVCVQAAGAEPPCRGVRPDTNWMSGASLDDSLTELSKHREEIGNEQDYAAVRQLIIREHLLLQRQASLASLVQRLDFTDLLRKFEGGAEPLGTKTWPTHVLRAVLVFAGPQSVGHIMCSAASLRTQAHRALPFALAMRARVLRSRSIESTGKSP